MSPQVGSGKRAEEALGDLFGRSRLPARVIRRLAGGSASRTELARDLHLDSGSMSRVSARLVNSGLATEKIDANAGGGVGRPSALLTLNEKDYWLIGLHVGVNGISASKVGIGGTVTTRVISPHDGTVSGVVDASQSAVEEIVAAEGRQPLGVGVSIGGWVCEGTVVRFTDLGWEDVPLEKHLTQATDLRVCVDSIGRAHAQSNLLFGLVSPTETFGHLYVGSVVEYALAVNGTVLRSNLGDGILSTIPIRTINGTTLSVRAGVSDKGVTEAACAAGLVAPGDGFETLIALAESGDEKASDMLLTRARHCAALICHIHEIVPLPKLVISASIVRWLPGAHALDEALTRLKWASQPPVIVRGGDVTCSLAQAAASCVWIDILDP